MCPDELPTRFKVITPYTSWALSHITARQVHSSEKSGSNLEGGETHSRCGLYLTGGWLCGYIQKAYSAPSHSEVLDAVLVLPVRESDPSSSPSGCAHSWGGCPNASSNMPHWWRISPTCRTGRASLSSTLVAAKLERIPGGMGMVSGRSMPWGAPYTIPR